MEEITRDMEKEVIEAVKHFEISSLCWKMALGIENEEIQLIDNVNLCTIRKLQYIDANNKKLKIKIFRILEKMCDSNKDFRENFTPFMIKYREKGDYDYEELIPYVKEIYKFYPNIAASIICKLYDYIEEPSQYNIYSNKSFINFVFFLISIDSYRTERYFENQVMELMPEQKEKIFSNKTSEQQEEIQETWKKCYRLFRDFRLETLRLTIVSSLENSTSRAVEPKKYSIIRLDLAPLYDLIEQ